MDLDASGRLYVGSWLGGEASVFVGPNVGFVTRVVPKDWKPAPFPDLKMQKLAALVDLLAAPGAVTRFHAQGEILRRGRDSESSRQLIDLASSTTASLPSRVAALWTLAQLDGSAAVPSLHKFLEDNTLREFALRALADRLPLSKNLDPQPFVQALHDPSPRVQAQALIALGRISKAKSVAVTRAIIPLTSRPADAPMPTRRPLQNQPDPARVVPHLAVQALRALQAHDVCLEALDGPHWRGGLWAMRTMHEPAAVEGLIKKLATVTVSERRRGVLSTLIRLYYREADYTGSWWGIRPDSTGPYYDRAEWEKTERIGQVIRAAVADADRDTRTFLFAEITRHQVELDGLPTEAVAASMPAEKPLALPTWDRSDPRLIGNMPYETALVRAMGVKGNAKSGATIFQSRSCVACHTIADGQTPKGPHLVDIGKRYKAEELIESIIKPSAKIAQGYEAYIFSMVDGQVFTGFVVSEGAQLVRIRENNGVQRVLKRDTIEARARQTPSAMPEKMVADLTPAQLADLVAYLQSLQTNP